MTKITLARALKYKKRVQQRIGEAAKLIQAHNSALVGVTREYDVKELRAEYLRLVEHLIDLKFKIYQANDEIYADILRLAELKSQIDLLRKMETTHGIPIGGYYVRDEKPPEYEACIREAEKVKLIRVLEKQVDDMQEALDAFNNRTRIEIELLV